MSAVLKFRAAADPGEQLRPSRGLESRLSSEVQEDHLSATARDWEPNRDPVLRYIAPLAGERYCDERVFSNIDRTENKCLDGRRHLRSEIFAHGFEIVRGNQTPAAVMLEEFANMMWCRLPHPQTVMRRMLDAYYYGWSPMQVLTDLDVSFKGRSVWMPRKIVNKPHHKLRFLREQEGIVWQPGHGHGGEGRVFRGDEFRLGWLTPIVGDLDHPYGRGLYSDMFLFVWAKKQMLRKFQTGSERQMGLTKITKKGAGGAGGYDEAFEEVKEQVSKMVELLNAENIIFQAGGFDIDFMTDLNFISGGLQALEYFDESIMTLICGEVLTSNPGDRGTQALGVVHRSVKTEYAKEASAECIEEPITELFHRFCVANFGEVDPGDLPRFVSRMRLSIDPKRMQMLYDMGAPIRGRRAAELLSLDEVVAGEEDESNEDEMILERPNPGTFGLAPGGGQFGQPGADDEEDEDEDDEMDPQRSLSFNRASGAPDPNEGVDRFLGSAIGSANAPLRKYVDELAEDFLSKNGLAEDPPKAPPLD